MKNLRTITLALFLMTMNSVVFSTPMIEADPSSSAMIGESLESSTGIKGSLSISETDLTINFTSTSELNAVHSALSEAFNDNSPSFRGGKEVALFKKASPSVVLILTESGSGTGSLITDSGHIITNWHVVENAEYVNVAFRPYDVSQEVYAEKSYVARVLKIDEVADLALIKLNSVPAGRTPLTIDDSGVEIGEDVIASGHPHGYTWTMTKGIVTGLRSDHNWRYDVGLQHYADVIQTQTPINPGNSGGPLFNDYMEIVGVNSFGGQGESTNFAVSASSLMEFLDRGDSRYAPVIPGTTAMQKFTGGCDGIKFVGEPWASEDSRNTMSLVDITCDGKAEAILSMAVDESSNRLMIDTNGDGNIDVTLLDTNGDVAWDMSFYDVDSDGESEIVAYHGDEGMPQQFESYGRFQSRFSN